VDLSGLAVPASFSDTVVLSATSIDPSATGFGGITFGNGSGTLLAILHKGSSTSQIVGVPATRDVKGRVNGFDAGSANVLLDLNYSAGGILQGSDGILWYGEGDSSDKRIIQRKPDGTTFEQTIPFAASPGGPRDCSFGPGETCLVMAKFNSDYFYVANLTATQEGFWQIGQWQTHSYRGETPLALEFWPDNDGSGDLMLFNGELVLLDGSGGNFWQPPFGWSRKKRLVATGLDVHSICHDPETGDLLYADKTGQIHQVEVIQDFPGFSPTADRDNSDTVDSNDLLSVLKWRGYTDLTGDGKWDHQDLFVLMSVWQWRTWH
jgi:hypothetical protein